MFNYFLDYKTSLLWTAIVAAMAGGIITLFRQGIKRGISMMIVSFIIVLSVMYFVNPIMFYTVSRDAKTFTCLPDIGKKLAYPHTVLITSTIAITPHNKMINGHFDQCFGLRQDEALLIDIGVFGVTVEKHQKTTN
jgi:hypothetical protein